MKKRSSLFYDYYSTYYKLLYCYNNCRIIIICIMNKPKNGAKSFEKNYIYLPMIHSKSCDDEITNLYTQKTNKVKLL